MILQFHHLSQEGYGVFGSFWTTNGSLSICVADGTYGVADGTATKSWLKQKQAMIKLESIVSIHPYAPLIQTHKGFQNIVCEQKFMQQSCCVADGTHLCDKNFESSQKCYKKELIEKSLWDTNIRLYITNKGQKITLFSNMSVFS